MKRRPPSATDLLFVGIKRTGGIKDALAQIAAGANLRAHRECETVLMRAASEGNAALVRLLIRLRVPLNTRLKRFMEEPTTALERAAENKRARVVRILIEAGANCSLVVGGDEQWFVAKVRAQIDYDRIAEIKQSIVRTTPVWGGFKRASL